MFPFRSDRVFFVCRVKEKPSLSLHKRTALSLHRLAPKPSKFPTPSDSGFVLHSMPLMPKARIGRCQHRKTASTGNWGHLLKENITESSENQSGSGVSMRFPDPDIFVDSSGRMSCEACLRMWEKNKNRTLYVAFPSTHSASRDTIEKSYFGPGPGPIFRLAHWTTQMGVQTVSSWCLWEIPAQS